MSRNEKHLGSLQIVFKTSVLMEGSGVSCGSQGSGHPERAVKVHVGCRGAPVWSCLSPSLLVTMIARLSRNQSFSFRL